MEVVWRVFSPELTPVVLQQFPLPRYFIYSFIFIVIANIVFQIDRLELSFTDSVSVSVSVYVIPFPDSGFRFYARGTGDTTGTGKLTVTRGNG